MEREERYNCAGGIWLTASPQASHPSSLRSLPPSEGERANAHTHAEDAPGPSEAGLERAHTPTRTRAGTPPTRHDNTSTKAGAPNKNHRMAFAHPPRDVEEQAERGQEGTHTTATGGLSNVPPQVAFVAS